MRQETLQEWAARFNKEIIYNPLIQNTIDKNLSNEELQNIQDIILKFDKLVDFTSKLLSPPFIKINILNEIGFINLMNEYNFPRKMKEEKND